MSKQVNLAPSVYYDDSFNQKRFKFKSINNNKQKAVDFVKEQSLHKNSRHHQQYFPSTPAMVADSSMSSNMTAKIKSSPRSKSGFRPKPTSRSVNLSQKSTKKQLVNQISKLANQLQSKNKMLGQKYGIDKIKQNEVMELYRIINYYEGKITQLQKQIKRYEEALQKIGRQCDEKSQHKTQIQEMVGMFQEMRKQNEDLSGKIQQKDYTIGSLQQQNHKIQMKINFLSLKQSFLKKSMSSSSGFRADSSQQQYKGKFNRQPTLNLKVKQQHYGNIHSKINKLEVNLNFLKKQNDNLLDQIQKKDSKIHDMQLEIAKYQEQNKRLKSQQPQKIGLINLKQEVSSNIKQDINVRSIKLQEPKSSKPQTKIQKKLSSKPSINSLKKAESLKQQTELATTTINLNKKLSQSAGSKYQKSDPFNKITILPKSINKKQQEIFSNQQSEIPGQLEDHILKQTINQSFQQCMLNIVQQSQKSALISQAISTCDPKIFLKLKYQLLTQQTSYQQLIQFLMNKQLKSEDLQQYPYNLKSVEAEWLISWVRQLAQQCEQTQLKMQQIIKQVIPKFENVTFRKQNNMKIQIANQLLNRQQQFEAKLASNGQDQGKINLVDLQKYFKTWGLHQAHIDTLCKQYFQQTGELESTTFSKVKEIINKWMV